MDENACSSSGASKSSDVNFTTSSSEIPIEKEAYVKLFRLSEQTVREICGGVRRSSRPRSKTIHFAENLILSQEKDDKFLVSEMEKILTRWVVRKARRNRGRVRRDTIMNKAETIIKKLKAQPEYKFQNPQFVVTRRWFSRYRLKSGWFSKRYVIDPELCPKTSRCNCPANSDVMSLQSVENTASPVSSEITDEDDSQYGIYQKKSPEIVHLMSSLELSNNMIDTNQDAGTSEFQPKQNIEDDCPIHLSDIDLKTKTFSECESKEETLTTSNLEQRETPKLNVGDLFSTNETLNLNIVKSESQEEVIILSDSDVQTTDDDEVPTALNSSAKCEKDSVSYFQQQLAKIIKKEKYVLQQIFNVQETVLFWKKSFTSSVIKDETVEGLPESKDPLTIVLGTNATGDCKFQPMVVYSVENPSPMKHIMKSSLPVIWKFHRRAEVTISHFEDWFTYSFIPSVRLFCMERNIPFKILLLLKFSRCHRVSLEYAHPNVKIVFLPANVASQLLPMNQGITDCFKANYLKRLLEVIIDFDEHIEISVWLFWKSYNILHALEMISAAWDNVSETDIVASWKMISTKLMTKETNPHIVTKVIKQIVKLAAKLPINLSEENVQNWISYHLLELNNEELVKLDLRSIQESDTEVQMLFSHMNCNRLLEAFQHLHAAMNIFESEDPNFKRSSFVRKNIHQSYECYKTIFVEQKKNAIDANDSHEASCEDMDTGDVK